MAYSSDKKFNKSGSSDKKSGSSGKFSRGKKEGERPFKSKDSAFKPDRKRFDKSDRPFNKDKEGSESKDRPFNRTEERSSKSFSKRDNSTDRKSSYGKPKREGDSKKLYPKKDEPYKKRDSDSEGKSSYNKTKRSSDSFKKPYSKREDGPYKKREDNSESNSRYDKTKRSSDSFKKPYSKREDGPYKKREDNSESKPSYDKSKRSSDSFKKPYTKREEGSGFKSDKRDFNKPGFDSKKRDDKSDDGKSKFRKSKRSFETNDNDSEYKSHKDDSNEEKNKYRGENSSHKKFIPKPKEELIEKEFDGLVRLNKYLSNAGICSRREADELIKAGAVSVNGKVITEMGFKVKSSDTINYGGEKLRNERKVYILLNKPKDYITTTDDPQERHTVMELIADACKERVYPVGRLDRNTLGLLLFTNDGEMAAKLMHPKFEIKKIYQVSIDKNIKPDDFKKLEDGFELEDGFIKPDEVSFITESKREIGIEIHSGKNRIVRRMFEHLGYEVVKLDRVAYAGLTKKDLPRSKWRFLTPKEVSFLKMIG